MLLLLTDSVLTAQPRFEAASIRPVEAGRVGGAVVRGGPGSSDPGLATLENIDLFSLVAMAYGVERHRISAPVWLNTTRFNITSRVPAGASVEDYRQMLQALLAERFGLAVHHEQREIQMAELVVAKNGPKLKESAPDPGAIATDGVQPPAPRAGPPPGYHGPVNMTLPRESMERFAGLLSGLFDQPVMNNTGLTGVYDITLHALVGSNPPNADAVNAPPALIDAVQDQLGLRLVPKKSVIDVLVVDRMEKIPTENR